MPFKYEELKCLFQKSELDFVATCKSSPEAELEAIAVLARANSDNGWPLGMLRVLRTQFSDALSHWTAGGYEDIRKAQEGEAEKCAEMARCLEDEFACLPLWTDSASHYSKSPRWHEYKLGDCLQLRSFMSCCRPGYTFAYALNYSTRLVFTKLASARLVGALTKEMGEGEVMLPKGSTFRVISINRAYREIGLEEVVHEY